MKTLEKLPKLKGQRVIIRVDYNVPLKGNKILDTKRIDVSFTTLDKVIKNGGTPLLISHIGEGQESLRPIATYLSKSYKIVFITRDINDKNFIHLLDKVPVGTVILLENIRRYKEEKKNNTAFAKLLASFGSFYINDAFPVSHRAHASLVGVPKYLPKFAGAQLAIEIKVLDIVLKNKEHPFLFILGGAKFSTKIPLLERFNKSADSIIIAGALLNSFYKVSGFEVGKSVVEKGLDEPIRKILKSSKLLLPVDVIVIRGKKNISVTPLEIEKGDTIVDIGPISIELISEKIKKAKLIVWNGPTGWYEKGFIKGTLALAIAVAKSKSQSVIGGGDTSEVIEKVFKGKKHKKVFLSTGGGATLDYLIHGNLVGIDALK